MQKRNLNQARVLQAARQIVNEDGADTLSFSKIAATLGVRSQALYAYFPNVQQLKFALIIDYLDGLTETLKAALVGVSGKEALFIFGDQLHTLLLAQPNLTKLAFGGISYDREAEAGDHLHQLILVLDRLIAPYCTSEAEVIAQARYFRAIIFGYVQNQLWGLFQLATVPVADSFENSLCQAITSITEKGSIKHG
ncbi:TetR/AcrR family transcriptional regulator [Lapidilactobacillus wuchangensis]|uniref:TetR/AcrR family transcriptional regulator n=1 Tax=Lapidilactobacillus wuchangensis TaxID=2486001 RepID=UPI001CDCAD4F|nr:TetR/AcrR family transcriptional regulator [Lapidilactobacillus wuchangensis]